MNPHDASAVATTTTALPNQLASASPFTAADVGTVLTWLIVCMFAMKFLLYVLDASARMKLMLRLSAWAYVQAETASHKARLHQKMRKEIADQENRLLNSAETVVATLATIQQAKILLGSSTELQSPAPLPTESEVASDANQKQIH